MCRKAEAEAGVEEATARRLDGDQMTNIQGPLKVGRGEAPALALARFSPARNQNDHVHSCDEVSLKTHSREQVQVYIQDLS
jgi:hypothetical protein